MFSDFALFVDSIVKGGEKDFWMWGLPNALINVIKRFRENFNKKVLRTLKCKLSCILIISIIYYKTCKNKLVN